MRRSLATEVLTVAQYETAPPVEGTEMLEKLRVRALRRYSERKVQRKRFKNHRWLRKSDGPRLLGRLRHNHFGCGCIICKPWKHRAGRKWASWERERENSEDDCLE